MDLLRRNPWMWWIFVPLGLTAWLSPLIAGTRAERRLWQAAGVVWFGLWLAAFALTAIPEETDPLSDAGVALLFISWFAPTVHTLILGPEYERRVALLSDPRLKQREEAIEQQEYARELVANDPRRARALGIGRPDVDGAYDGGVVDLNHASAEAIVRATGVDAEIVAQIVANRDDVGGFRSVEELGALLDVPAHVVDDLRDRAVFLPL